MDISLDSLFNKRKTFSLTSDDTVELTERGLKAAEDSGYSGVKAQIIMNLQNGSSTIKELSQDTRIPLDIVKRVVGLLMRKAEIRKVGFNG
jgi:hypothetical protein